MNNSHARVMAALNHEQTDGRIPTDFTAVPETTEALMARWGVKTSDELLAGLEIDIRTVEPRYIGTDEGYKTDDGTDFDCFGVIHDDLVQDGKTFHRYRGPFGMDTTVSDVLNHRWPDPERVNMAKTPSLCDRYRDYGTITGPWSPMFNQLFNLFGMQETMYLLFDKPEVIHAAVDKIAEFYYRTATRLFEICEGKVDIFITGDDFGCQQGLTISPEMYDEYFREPFQRLFSLAKDHGMKVMIHSCGSIFDLIPTFMAMGADIIDPVQTTANKMEPRKLKEAYGDKMCFHGAIDQQNILTFGTVAEVREHVRYTIKTLGTGGGYILCPSHDLLPNVPLDNILAMYDEAAKFRF